MHVNIVKTYACRHATPISKPVKAKTTAKGITEATAKTPPTESIVHANPLKILTKV